MTSGAASTVVIGLSKSVDRQQARDLVEVRAGWTLIAALASGRAMSEQVAKADLVIFDDTLDSVDVVLRAVRASSDPPSLAILSERSPAVVARELQCSPKDVVVLSAGVSLHAVLLRVLAGFEAQRPRQRRAEASAASEVTPSTVTPSTVRTDPAGHTQRLTGTAATKRELLLIGASTGGPDALGVVLAGLPRDFPAPILITQHMRIVSARWPSTTIHPNTTVDHPST